MNIVIIGLGEVGRHLLSVLDKEGHDIVAVDANAKAVQYAEEHYDVASMVGYGASETLLKIAGVARADLVAAVTNHDEMNLIAALAAKQLGAKHVVARVQGTAWSEWTEGIRYGLLGVDVVINPRVLVAQELSRIARSYGASDVVDLAQDRVELVQIGFERRHRAGLQPVDEAGVVDRDAVDAFAAGQQVVEATRLFEVADEKGAGDAEEDGGHDRGYPGIDRARDRRLLH